MTSSGAVPGVDLDDIGAGEFDPARRLADLEDRGVLEPEELVTFTAVTYRGRLPDQWILAPASAHPFDLEGRTWPTVEAYVAAAKARRAGRVDLVDPIVSTSDVAAVRDLATQVPAGDAELWRRTAYVATVWASLAKFAQHPQAGAYLDSTGDRVLVEASRRDRWWGVGLSSSDPAVRHPALWRGPNMLGFALAEVRARLRRLT